MRQLYKLFFSKNGQRVWLSALILLPIILWILPGDYFDAEDGMVLCPSRLFFDVECYGCGITRSVMHMHHFQFDDAVFYNLGGLIVYPALIGVWAYWVYLASKRLKIIPFKKS